VVAVVVTVLTVLSVGVVGVDAVDCDSVVKVVGVVALSRTHTGYHLVYSHTQLCVISVPLACTLPAVLSSRSELQPPFIMVKLMDV